MDSFAVLEKGLINYFNLILPKHLNVKPNPIDIKYIPLYNTFLIMGVRILIYELVNKKLIDNVFSTITKSIVDRYPQFKVDIHYKLAGFRLDDISINEYIYTNSSVILIRYDTVKLEDLPDIGLYAEIFSYIDHKKLLKIKTLSKYFNKIMSDQLLWIELIRLNYPNYLKSKSNNYKQLYFGFNDYYKLLDYLEELDYKPDDSDDEDEEEVWTIYKFYKRNPDTFKYMLSNDLFGEKLESSLLPEFLMIKDLYRSENTKLLISYIERNKEEPRLHLLVITRFQLALAYSDVAFLEYFYNLYIEISDDTAVKDDLTYILSEYSELKLFNAENFEWLLSKLNLELTPDLSLELMGKIRDYDQGLLPYLIDKLPIDVDKHILDQIYENIIEVSSSVGSSEELYLLSLKYLNKFTKEQIIEVLELMINTEEYSYVIALIDKYRNIISKEMMLDIIESLDIHFDIDHIKEYPDELVEFLRYIKKLN